MTQYIRAGFLTAALALGGCTGRAPFQVEIDKVVQNFNAGSTAQASTVSSVYKLTIAGREDPIPNAVDDESSLALVVNFDAAVLATLPRGVPVTMHGRTTFPVNPAGNYYRPLDESQITFVGAANNNPVIKSAWLTQSCFCSRYGGAETQDFEGTITVTNGNNGALRFVSAITMDGAIPFHGFSPTPVSSHVVITTDVQVTSTP